MDEDEIEAFADAFYKELNLLEESIMFNKEIKDAHRITIFYCIAAIGEVINGLNHTYDMRYFYKRAGLPEPWPEHPLKY